MARQARCILFTGAPDSDRLDWDEKTLLSEFSIGASKLVIGTDNQAPQPTASWQAPVWRSIRTSSERAIPGYALTQTQFFYFSAQIPDLDITTKQDFLQAI